MVSRALPPTRATPDEERRLAERRRSRDLPFDQRPVLGSTIADLDLELFRSTYLPVAVGAEVLAENDRSIEQYLASLRLFDLDSTAPTALGLLVVGFDPSAWIPGAYVQFVRYEGCDSSSNVLDHEELRGNVIGQLDALGRLIPANIRTAIKSTGDLRQQDVPDYPLVVRR